MGRGGGLNQASAAYQMMPRSVSAAQAEEPERGYAEIDEHSGEDRNPLAETETDLLCPVCGQPLSRHKEPCSGESCPFCGEQSPFHQDGCRGQYRDDKYYQKNFQDKRPDAETASRLADLSQSYRDKNTK